MNDDTNDERADEREHDDTTAREASPALDASWADWPERGPL